MKTIAKTLGKFIGYIVTGVGIAMAEVLVFRQLGYFNLLIETIILGPIGLFIVPIYAIIKWGVWFPLIFIYGGYIISFTLISIGGGISEDVE